MDFFEQIVALRREGQPFAVATVVGRHAPVSAHLGDRAIVFADGRMEGFVGGACSREIVRKQALDALATRCGRLVSIRPDAKAAAGSTPEHVIVPMTCVSEGAIDVYVEPFVQPRRLIVVGATPVAAALARLARSMDYEVVRAVDTPEHRDIEQEAASLGVKLARLDDLEGLLKGGADEAVVVASQGHYDDLALTSALKRGSGYVGLVASRKRGASVRGLLQDSGVPGVATIRNPAGLDLGARTPAEVALSILAEIVQLRPAGTVIERPAPAEVRPADTSSAAPTIAIDPVCQMEVEIATARHTAELDGVVYYFCCAACRSGFLKDPSKYRAGA